MELVEQPSLVKASCVCIPPTLLNGQQHIGQYIGHTAEYGENVGEKSSSQLGVSQQGKRFVEGRAIVR